MNRESYHQLRRDYREAKWHKMGIDFKIEMILQIKEENGLGKTLTDYLEKLYLEKKNLEFIENEYLALKGKT
jgi:hypothetical protein